MIWIWYFKALEDAGVICGGDMTPEAALTKLSYVLSKETWTLEKKRKVSVVKFCSLEKQHWYTMYIVYTSTCKSRLLLC